MSIKGIYIGCAGWNIPKAHAAHFPRQGSHLERYAALFPAVEINSSFYRPHRPKTYTRWAASVPEGFRFAVKVPRQVTHTSRLADLEHLERFLVEANALGEKLGPLLVQLPPSLVFNPHTVEAFLSGLRQRFAGQVACEPRHPTWFEPEVDRLLAGFQVARVAADPAPHLLADQPAGWDGLFYYRLHGSPQMYYSAYSEESLQAIAGRLQRSAEKAPTWCILDNTAEGAATLNALHLLRILNINPGHNKAS